VSNKNAIPTSGDTHGNQLGNVERCFGALNLGERRAGRRKPRCEQRATVLVLEDRRLIGSDPLRVHGDLFLVHADERPEDRERRHSADD